jgi:3-oxoacyl-[acyl-carrier-protein] synthase III
MKFNNVVISAYASYVSDEIISSEEIESRLAPVYERLNLPVGRLELMTGIKERRVWPIGTRPSDLSFQAADNIFNNGKIKILKEDIGILIHSSVCRDFLEPSTASVVHHKLGLSPQCLIYDLSNACLGMLSSFNMVANLIESGQIKHGLIVSGENGGPLIEETIKKLNADQTLTRKSIKKYIANLTIGSGAVAYILSHKDEIEKEECHKLCGSYSLVDSEANILCQGDGDTSGLMMETNSEELMKAGVKLAKDAWINTKSELGWSNADVDIVLGHQIGSAHETLLMNTLELNNHRTYNTYKKFGNTGSAALPITFIEMAKNEDISKGSKLALLGIGSGLNSIMMGVEW